MPINPDAVGAEGGPVERSWDARQCMLYALGVGCGVDELQFDTEKNQQVLPTFAVIIGGGGAPLGSAGEFNPAMLVHGEQAIELGARCRRPGADCLPIPAGVAAFAELLREIHSKQLALPSCSTALGQESMD